jgi:antibiotic biosynthesis monooxygenase (ABM) superfamily enzyme
MKWGSDPIKKLFNEEFVFVFFLTKDNRDRFFAWEISPGKEYWWCRMGPTNIAAAPFSTSRTPGVSSHWSKIKTEGDKLNCPRISPE